MRSLTDRLFDTNGAFFDYTHPGYKQLYFSKKLSSPKPKPSLGFIVFRKCRGVSIAGFLAHETAKRSTNKDFCLPSLIFIFALVLTFLDIIRTYKNDVLFSSLYFLSCISVRPPPIAAFPKNTCTLILG